MVTPVRSTQSVPRPNMRLVPPVEEFEHPVESAKFQPFDTDGLTPAQYEREAILESLVIALIAAGIAVTGILTIAYYVMRAR